LCVRVVRCAWLCMAVRSGGASERAFHLCPGNTGQPGELNINYTCAVGKPYTVELVCSPAAAHACVYWVRVRGCCQE
jgi:hypothetical protein